MATFRDVTSNSPFTTSPSAPPFCEAPPVTEARTARARSTGASSGPFAATRRRLATGLRGARLYVVAPPNGKPYWFVEVLRDGVQLSRRFASELHARAWLTDLLRPCRASSSFDWEELNRPFRTATLMRH